MTTNDLLETSTQNFVGNEVTDTQFLHGMYTLTGEDQFEYSNNVKGDIIPIGTSILNDSSYYLKDKPTFWGLFTPWPSVGYPNQLGTGTIPAKLRYQSGSDFTICPDSIITHFDNHLSIASSQIVVWPNPANNFLKIDPPENCLELFNIKITNLLGNVVYKYSNGIGGNKTITIPVGNLKSGIYVLTYVTKSKVFSKKIVISH